MLLFAPIPPRESFTPTSILHAITAHAAHLAGCPASRARLLHVLLLCATLTALPIARCVVRLAARACLPPLCTSCHALCVPASSMHVVPRPLCALPRLPARLVPRPTVLLTAATGL
jgi:hypothetical protein